MKKFVFLYCGQWTPTQEMKDAWGKWFASVGDKFLDSGSPFGSGKEVTVSDTQNLPQDQDAITGYSIIKAENLDEAVQIAKSCPIITSVRIYEAMSM